MSTKAVREQEKAEAIEKLRGMLKPGDTVYTVLRHRSRSGMQRVISPLILPSRANGLDRPFHAFGWVAKAIGARADYDRGGVVLGGCGMDMGFHLVYNLSRTLWPTGHGCTGDKCPSNDHMNGDRDYTPHGQFAPQNAVKRASGIWDPDSQSVQHWHGDGGYALRHEWI